MKNNIYNKGFTQAPTFSQSGAGFTLIEILIVTVIIGILAAIIFTNITVVKRSRDAQRKSDLRKIQTALEQYRADNGEYPLPASNILPANCNSGTSFGNPPCTIIYLNKIPKDPNGSGWPWYGGNYFHSGDNNSYTLIACIENTSDPERFLLPNFPLFQSCPGLNGYRVSNQ